MSTLRQCIEAYEAGLASRPPGRPINVIHPVVMSGDAWRFTYAKHTPLLDGPGGRRCERRQVLRLAEAGEILGMPVGVVWGEVES